MVFAFLGALLSTAPGRLLAQTPAPPAAAEIAERVRLTVEREFVGFKVVAKFQPMFGDFDGDRKEDLAVVVTGSPARDQVEHNFKLIDPYDSFFGYGNARVTMSFPIHSGRAGALCGNRPRLARRAPQGEIRDRESALRAHRGQPRPMEEEARFGAFRHRFLRNASGGRLGRQEVSLAHSRRRVSSGHRGQILPLPFARQVSI